MSRLFSRVYYFLLRKLVLPGYPAGGFDLALMDRAMLAPLRDSAKSAFLPLLAYWLGFKPAVLALRATAEEARPLAVDAGQEVPGLPRRHARVLGDADPRDIGGRSASSRSSSFLYGVAVVVAALVGGIPVPGFSTIVALVTFLLGLIILMLGVIGEYLWRIFDESNQRPEAVVDEVH